MRSTRLMADGQRKTDAWWYPTPERVTLVLLTIILGLAAINTQRLSNLIGDQAQASKGQCLRGNESRPEQIRVYLDVARGNRARAAAWTAIGEAFPATAPVTEAQHDANIAEARKMEGHAEAVASAQSEVSLHPRAPRPQKRAVVDCEKEFG